MGKHCYLRRMTAKYAEYPFSHFRFLSHFSKKRKSVTIEIKKPLCSFFRKACLPAAKAAQLLFCISQKRVCLLLTRLSCYNAYVEAVGAAFCLEELDLGDDGEALGRLS